MVRVQWYFNSGQRFGQSKGVNQCCIKQEKEKMKIDELAKLMGKRREEVEHILKNNDVIELDLNEVEWWIITIKDKLKIA